MRRVYVSSFGWFSVFYHERFCCRSCWPDYKDVSHKNKKDRLLPKVASLKLVNFGIHSTTLSSGVPKHSARSSSQLVAWSSFFTEIVLRTAVHTLTQFNIRKPLGSSIKPHSTGSSRVVGEYNWSAFTQHLHPFPSHPWHLYGNVYDEQIPIPRRNGECSARLDTTPVAGVTYRRVRYPQPWESDFGHLAKNYEG
ncbi:hypothetical protein BaRGS_00034463 [Batillaria attramentaria]|uniref:Uncharacterized protein n=1 Tax=Batillaria attramentaria TaxID=370345 RepID=A0ABD0JHE8_9CAEN